MHTRATLSRKSALTRSHKISNRALQTFRASPSRAARIAIEHALDAVHRAHQLAEDPQLRGDEDARRWDDVWLAAHWGLHDIAKQRGER